MGHQRPLPKSSLDLTVAGVETTPAGWYPDPANPSQQRLWDGADWTDSVRTPPVAGPATATPVQPVRLGDSSGSKRAGSVTGSWSLSLGLLLLLVNVVWTSTIRTRIESDLLVMPLGLYLPFLACGLVGAILGLVSLRRTARSGVPGFYWRAVFGLTLTTGWALDLPFTLLRALVLDL